MEGVQLCGTFPGEAVNWQLRAATLLGPGGGGETRKGEAEKSQRLWLPEEEEGEGTPQEGEAIEVPSRNNLKSSSEVTAAQSVLWLLDLAWRRRQPLCLRVVIL